MKVVTAVAERRHSDEHTTVYMSSLAIPAELAEQFGAVCLDLRIENPDDAVREAIEHWCKGNEHDGTVRR